MSIEPKTRADGKRVYRVRFVDHLGKRACKTFDRKDHARAFEAEVRHARQLGELATLTKAKMPFSEFADEWMEDRRRRAARGELAAKTLTLDKRIVYGHLTPRLATCSLSSFVAHPRIAADLQEALRTEGVGPDMTRKCLTTLKAMLRMAHERRYIPRDPLAALSVQTPKRSRRVQPFPVEAVERMRTHMLGVGDDRSALLVSLLAYCGLRPGEAIGLQWNRVTDGKLVIDGAITGDELGATKTGNHRTVPVPRVVMQELRAWQMRTGGREGGFVFENCHSSHWREVDYRNWRRRTFRPAAAAAGYPNARPYDCRHSFVSALIHEGRSIIEVARLAGHSPTVALDTYGHVFETAASERTPVDDQIERARNANATASPPVASEPTREDTRGTA